jgi:hypothetical protein
MTRETSRFDPRAGKKVGSRGRSAGPRKKVVRKASTGIGKPLSGRIEAVLRNAERVGLLREKDGRITGRVSSGLIRKAKARTGISSDTELIAFALANVALEDNFGEVFRSLEGRVSPDVDLEF